MASSRLCLIQKPNTNPMVPYLTPNIRCPTFDVRSQVARSHATKKHTSLPQNFPQCAQITPIYHARLAQHRESIKDLQEPTAKHDGR